MSRMPATITRLAPQWPPALAWVMPRTLKPQLRRAAPAAPRPGTPGKRAAAERAAVHEPKGLRQEQRVRELAQAMPAADSATG